MNSKLDELLVQLGTGWWNILHYCSLVFTMALPASQALGGAFLTPNLEYFCIPTLPEASEDDSESVLLSSNNSFHRSHNDSYRGKCTYLVQNTENGTMTEETCTKWRFDNTTFATTITADFQLVCNRSYLIASFTSVYMSGMFIGALLCGIFSDRYGRKRVMVYGILTFIAIACVTAWVPNLSALLVLRFLQGLMTPFVTNSTYVLVMEITEPRFRSYLGISASLPWAFAMVIFGGLGHLVRRWRWLQFTVSIPGILVLPLLWYMDESPRWLAVTGQHDQALRTLKRAARMNRSVLPTDEELREILRESQNKEGSGKSHHGQQDLKTKLMANLKNSIILFRTPRLRKITISLYISYLIVNMVYYGLSLSGGSLSDNPFIYMALSGLMEVPAYTLNIPIVARFGRKLPSIVSFVLSGVTLLAIAPTPSSYGGLILTLAMIGKVAITSAYQIIIFFSSELFPTEVRSRGIGTCFMMSRIGSIISPFINGMLGPAYPWAPSALFGGVSIIVCLIVKTLPETSGVALPDTIAQLEARPNQPKKRSWLPVPTTETPTAEK